MYLILKKKKRRRKTIHPPWRSKRGEVGWRPFRKMGPLWAGSSFVTAGELPTEGRLGATDLAWFCCAFWRGRSVLSSSYLQEGHHRALQSSCQHRLHLCPIALAWSRLGRGKRSFPPFKKRTPRPSLWDIFWGCYLPGPISLLPALTWPSHVPSLWTHSCVMCTWIT